MAVTPADALVGAGHGQTYVTRRSQDAVAAYQPVYERFAAMVGNSGQLPGTFTVYGSYDDFLERGSALVGSPQQVIDKVGRYHDAFGNRLIAIGGLYRVKMPQAPMTCGFMNSVTRPGDTR